MTDETDAPLRIPRAAWLGWAAGAVLLAALAAVVLRRGEAEAFAALARDAEPSWLAAGIVLQAATYACAAAVWNRALRALGSARPFAGLVPLGLAKLFADQALPSAGLSGTVLVVRALRRRGVARGDAVAAMLAGLIGYYGAYALAVSAALAALWWRGELHPLLLSAASLFAVVAVAVPLALWWLRARRPRWLRRIPVAREALAAIAEAPREAVLGPRLAAEMVGLQLGVFLLDAATLLAMLRAVATPAAPDVVFASFMVASLVATLAWVPGGLGTFEGTCIAMLQLHGISLEAAAASTLLLRGLTFWLPMAPGLWLARREMRAEASPHAQGGDTRR